MKKNKKKKKDKVPKQLEEKEKKEESKLEEEVETQETSSLSNFRQFLQVNPKAPILERVTQEEPETISLEKGIEITPISGKKESERKYSETIKYNIESEYQGSLKKQREITPDMESQISPISSIDLTRVGRERIIPGKEFHMGSPAEMPVAPASQEEYDLLKPSKSKKFTGEKTIFQENLERRYEIK